jgi:pimeloyl-ACP methyl ester carboxylesterase
MSFVEVAPDVRLRVRVDDFTDPWRSPQTVVLVHGFGESGRAWFGWVPHLARHYRVVRVDQRGFGESTVMPADFPWSLDILVSDLAAVIATLGDAPVHLVGAKIAGPVIARLAATRPDLSRSITMVGSMSKGPSGVDDWLRLLESQGVSAWTRQTMPPRLGSDMSRQAMEWWIDLTSATPLPTFLGLFRVVPSIDVTADLPSIRCPALVISTHSDRRPVELTQSWQSLIKNSRLVVLDGDAYHPAASSPDRCALEALQFLQHCKAEP